MKITKLDKDYVSKQHVIPDNYKPRQHPVEPTRQTAMTRPPDILIAHCRATVAITRSDYRDQLGLPPDIDETIDKIIDKNIIMLQVFNFLKSVHTLGDPISWLYIDMSGVEYKIRRRSEAWIKEAQDNADAEFTALLDGVLSEE